MKKLIVLLSLALLLAACSAPRSRVFVATIEQYPAAGGDVALDVYVVHYILDGVPYEASVRGIGNRTALVKYLEGYAK